MATAIAFSTDRSLEERASALRDDEQPKRVAAV